ncbi:MAG: restriction endonuclease subunit S [Sedimentisphaerales bacterium]|nr:restriction endonuclease subunit S [Sedimentisphaerales bacterium]
MKKGWTTKRIGDVCDLMTGGTPSRSKPEYFGGNIKWLVSGDIHQHKIYDCEGRITEEGMRNSNAKLLPLNSVMIALNGQGKTRGTVALLRTQATCNQSLVSICPRDHAYLLPEYLYLNLHGRYQELRTITCDSGNDRRGLNMILVRNIEVPIPPLPEQRRIVGILDAAFEGIATAKANAEKNLQNARDLFDSYLNTVFTQKGEGWVEKRLEQIGTTQTGSTPKTSDRANYGDFIPFVKPADFNTDGSLDYENDGLSDKGLAEARKITAGSVLMVCIGATIGKCGYCDRDITTNQQTNALTPFDGVSHKFVYYQMLTESFQRRVLLSSGQATLPIINKSKWSALTVALPPKLEDQKRIVAKFEALRAETQHLELIYRQKIATLEELKKSLLHQAFNGEL